MNHQEGFKEHNELRVLTWPPNSPDLDPIEQLWDVLDKQVWSVKASLCNLQDRVPDTWAHLQRESPQHFWRTKANLHNIWQVVIMLWLIIFPVLSFQSALMHKISTIWRELTEDECYPATVYQLYVHISSVIVHKPSHTLTYSITLITCWHGLHKPRHVNVCYQIRAKIKHPDRRRVRTAVFPVGSSDAYASVSHTCTCFCF